MLKEKIRLIAIIGVCLVGLSLVCARADKVQDAAERTVLVIYPLHTGNIDWRISPTLTSLVRSEVVKSDRIRVVPEELFYELIAKQDIQATDFYEQRDTQVQLGRLLKADKIVVGGFGKVGYEYILTLEVVDVAAGVIDHVVAVKGSEAGNDLSRMAVLAGERLRDAFDPQPKEPPAPQPAPGHLNLPEPPPIMPAEVSFKTEPRLVLRGHKYNVHALAYSNDGSLLFSGATDKTIKVWNADTGELVRTLMNHTGTVLSLAVSSDGKLLLSGSRDGTAVLWDIETFAPIEQFKLGGDVYGVAFSPDAVRIALAGGSHVVALQKKDDKWQGIWNASVKEVLSLAYSPDGDLVTAGGEYGLIRIFNADNGMAVRKIERTEEMREVRCLAFDPYRRYLASGSDDDLVHVWTANGLERFRMGGHLSDVNAVAVGADGNVIFSAGSDQKVKAWSVDSGRLLDELSTGRGDLLAVAVRPGGKEIAAAGRDSMVRVHGVEMISIGQSEDIQ